jgi:hypothetical protein
LKPGARRLCAGAALVLGCSSETAIVAALDAPAEAGASGTASTLAGGAARPEAKGGSGGAGESTAGVAADPSGAGGEGGERGESGGAPAPHGGEGGRLGNAESAGEAGAPGGASGSGAGVGGGSEIVRTFCTCGDEASSVCGSDGVTYDRFCGAACPEVMVLCFHACPCGGDGGAVMGPSVWTPIECFDASTCAGGSVCIPTTKNIPDAVACVN